jgi:hypothetical protein
MHMSKIDLLQSSTEKSPPPSQWEERRPMKNIVRPHSKGEPEAGHDWLNYSNFKQTGGGP